MIAENLQIVNAKIAEAARKSGRDPGRIGLIAVTKTVPVDRIREAMQAGLACFGENKIQEAKAKIEILGRTACRWHFIGHLQKNKVKFLFDRFDLVHSVDGFELAEAIHAQSLERRWVMPILIQVNISGERSKSGVDPAQLQELLVRVAPLPGIQVRGLMALPPMDPDPERSRPYFSRLRELRDGCAKMGIDNIRLDDLSMGMSNDYPVAIEEGATLVRVGSALFGPRPRP